jgi:mycothiol system anti-sigma-R factor
MLCDDVKRVVYFFLDGALEPQKERDFSSHLSLCPECEARTNLHRRLRIFVQRRLTPLSAPNHLKVRLTRVLRAVRTEWS